MILGKILNWFYIFSELKQSFFEFSKIKLVFRVFIIVQKILGTFSKQMICINFSRPCPNKIRWHRQLGSCCDLCVEIQLVFVYFAPANPGPKTRGWARNLNRNWAEPLYNSCLKSETCGESIHHMHLCPQALSRPWESMQHLSSPRTLCLQNKSVESPR